MVNKKRKFNFIDLLIILIILGALVFGLRRFKTTDLTSGPSTKQESLIISYYIEEVPDYVAQAIEVGSPVKEEVQASNFGKIIDKKLEESVSWSKDENGQAVASSKEGYSSISLTMEAEGIVGENGVTIDKSTYYIGQTVALHAGNSLLKNGRISNIKIAN